MPKFEIQTFEWLWENVLKQIWGLICFNDLFYSVSPILYILYLVFETIALLHHVSFDAVDKGHSPLLMPLAMTSLSHHVFASH